MATIEVDFHSNKFSKEDASLEYIYPTKIVVVFFYLIQELKLNPNLKYICLPILELEVITNWEKGREKEKEKEKENEKEYWQENESKNAGSDQMFWPLKKREPHIWRTKNPERRSDIQVFSVHV